MRTQFNKEFIPVQQKGRRVPVHLQERVEKELNKLMDQKHIIKLDKCSDRQLISPIVITVRKDQMVKLALDSKKINKFIHKNKYQMPNIDLLLDNSTGSSIKQQSTNSILNTGLALHVLTNPVRQINSGTMQLQFNRWQRYMNLPIPNGILRPHG